MEYGRCVDDCDYTCAEGAFSGDDACDVLIDVAQGMGQNQVSALGAYRMQCAPQAECALLRTSIAGNENCCPTSLGLSNYNALCPKEFPKSVCSSACAPAFLYFHQKCGNWVENNMTATDADIADEMQTTSDICRGTLLRDGARRAYESVSGSSTVYLSVGAYIMAVPPILFFMLFVFFGRHVSTLFRMIVAGAAFAIGILWPTLSPFFGRCGMGAEAGLQSACDTEGPPPVTAGTLGQIAFACVVASCTAYTCRQKLRVGNGIQGFIVGYIVAMWTTNLWIGGMTQNLDTTWLIFGIQLLFGAGGAFLNVVFPVRPPRAARAARGAWLGASEIHV